MLDVDVNDGVYVNDERRKFENDSERALSQAQRDHERKQAIHQGVHGENQHTFEKVKVKVPPTFCEPTKEERRSAKPHTVLSVHGVRSASRPRALTESTPNRWGTRNTFL